MNKHELYLIEILHQTTTVLLGDIEGRVLYLIEILHQTTTDMEEQCAKAGLYLIEILHQTTTHRSPVGIVSRCILLKFYIKPQLVEQ